MGAASLGEHDSIAGTLLRKLDLDVELVIKFFAMFSRMEYALKRAGYCSNRRWARADWARFACELDSQFRSDRTEDLLRAVTYLQEHPPKKQIAKQHGGESRLAWSDTLPSGQSDLDRLLGLVRRVRNNLFHGGKYPEGPEEEASRNRCLIASCLVILEECLLLCDAATRTRLRAVHNHFTEV